MIQFQTAAPTFAVTDVGATLRWYREQLGCKIDHFPAAEPYMWGCATRDDVQIMFQQVEGYEKPDLSPRRPGGAWDAYIRVKGVKNLHAVLKPFVEGELVTRPYGCMEFKVRDPNGCVLVFSEMLE